MALSKQIYIYSLDTDAFFTDAETEIEQIRKKHFIDRTQLKKEHNLVQTALNSDTVKMDKLRKELFDLHKKDQDYEPEITEECLEDLDNSILEHSRQIRRLREELDQLFENNHGIRSVRTEWLRENNVIAVFESTLTRTLQLTPDKLCEDLIVVQTYYFRVFEDLIRDGFMMNGEKYCCLTASAGQIRTKKTVFIKESVWNTYKTTLMCGLTLEKINAKGGINVNKYLAYLALCNSATDEWTDFDIDKSIVVDDFETLVHGTVDFVDHHTYTVERKEMDVPITHTDGCGMMLPKLSKKNFMVRPPWIKGLLAVFPFDRFIKQKKASGKIRDIYGKEYDILADDIQVIFTKSQFKMWKFYDSWEDYKAQYKQYGCTTGICNMEEDQIDDARINYQMLQTLPDLSDAELEQLCSASRDKLTNLCHDRATMLRVFHATPENKHKSHFETALMLYPELLQDAYSRQSLKARKESMERQAWAGKIDIKGKYTFIIPDLYAFCEWLFLGIKNPKGLLADGEVFCKLYPPSKKLDCLRSPHLYMEHAVRVNAAGDKLRTWFATRGCYTSCHDLISKILQFDVDGDKSLVCADETIIHAAERNGEDIVPLYYDMAKAGAQKIDKAAIFQGMRAAYVGGNIGIYSNDISKIWNSEKPGLHLIKLLCCENNFVIDYAKTLYKPSRPPHISNQLAAIHNEKLPYFFRHAKDKESFQIAEPTQSPVNRIASIILPQRFNFSTQQLGKFDYQMLLHDPNIDIDNPVAKEIIRHFRDQIACKNFYSYRNSDKDNIDFLCHNIRFDMLTECTNEIYIADVLIKYLFNVYKSRSKVAFWKCYGEFVVKNLLQNLKKNEHMCIKCGMRFQKNNPNQQYCKLCASKKSSSQKTGKCIDCGKKLKIARNGRTKRCAACRKEAIKATKRQYAAENRTKINWEKSTK